MLSHLYKPINSAIAVARGAAIGCTVSTCRGPRGATSAQQRDVNNKTVPDDVRRVILTSIPSVPYLEALLLLRSERGRSWPASLVASRLYVGEKDAADLLQAMESAGLARLGEDGGFGYAPSSAELHGIIDALASTYSQNLVGVTDLIHSRVEKRAQQFADAFRWKREGK